MSDHYSINEKKELLRLARHTIKDHLQGKKKVYLSTQNPKFLEKRGVFVTLHINHELRGCIGYPLPIKLLHEAVVDNAISAATEDPRFGPLTLEELEQTDLEISVLTVPEEVSGPEQVQVGRDGIIISKNFARGLLLPQVPVEQKWNLEEYISYGCLKAGLSAEEWKRGVKIETFQAIVFSEKELLES